MKAASPELPFPRMGQLPSLLVANGWTWERLPTGTQKHWLGRDPQGQRWLVKMGGSFNALRERAFGSVAQQVGLACQSSVLLCLPPDSRPLLEEQDADPCQIAILFVERHTSHRGCPFRELDQALEAAGDHIEVLQSAATVRFAVHQVSGNMLGALCGANERCEVLRTRDHEVILIDNEETFSGPPVDLLACTWLPGSWRRPVAAFMSPAAMFLAMELCTAFAALRPSELRQAVSIPEGYRLQPPGWPLLPCLTRAQAKARTFLAANRLGG